MSWLSRAILLLVLNAVLAPYVELPAAGQEAKQKSPKQKPKKKNKAAPPGDRDRAPSRSEQRFGPELEGSFRKIGTAIRESMELGPTLAIWLVDRTPSAQAFLKASVVEAKHYYDSTEVRQWAAAKTPNLQTVIATFDDKLEFVLDPPTSDPDQIDKALSSIHSASSPRELTFAAIKQTLDKFLPRRLQERHEVLLIVITDEAGDDPAAADDLLAAMRSAAIPLYVVGCPAPWGESNPFAQDPKTANASSNDDSIPTVGPESLFSERVDVLGWAPEANMDLVESGFGSFALERLCRASRGKFFLVRPEPGFFAGSARQWPTGRELRFDEGIQKKYAPDYVSDADYRKLLATNKARAILHEAAQRPKVILEGTPVTRFPKAAEAQMAKRSSQAQQFAASNSPAVNDLYDLLVQGEADREKLIGPRWQAEFDLAIGRVMASKVRLDGYNSMIAALKRGKTFANASSTAWILTPADAFETESTLRRLGERAKTYLERVAKEHPGTPWAKIAEEELRIPLGWTWKET